MIGTRFTLRCDGDAHGRQCLASFGQTDTADKINAIRDEAASYGWASRLEAKTLIDLCPWHSGAKKAS